MEYMYIITSTDFSPGIVSIMITMSNFRCQISQSLQPVWTEGGAIHTADSETPVDGWMFKSQTEEYIVSFYKIKVQMFCSKASSTDPCQRMNSSEEEREGVVRIRGVWREGAGSGGRKRVTGGRGIQRKLVFAEEEGEEDRS